MFQINEHSNLRLHRINWEEDVRKLHTSEKYDVASKLNTTDVSLRNQPVSSAFEEKREIFLIIYSCLMILGIIFAVSRSFSFLGLCLRISVNLHDMIFRGITRAKMVFFNNNPSGRILNRFSKDINNVDILLPPTMVDVFDVSV